MSIRELLIHEKLHKALQAVCEKLNQQEQAANSIVITPVLPTMEPEDSLIMGDENLSTIPEKEPDEFINSSVEDLVSILSEFEDTSDNDNECDLPFCDNSVTFSNPLFDINDDFTSSDDESLPEEDIQEENFKIYSNPLFKFNDEYISKDSALLVTHLSDANKDECFDPGGDINEIDAFLNIDVPMDIKDGYHDSDGDIIYLEKDIRDDESLPEEDIQEENFKIYSNPLFKFNDEYISKDVNPLFNEVLEDIKSKDSYVSNFDESALLVTHLSDANKDECFDPGGDIDEIDAFLDIDVPMDIKDGYHDSEGDIIYLESLLINDTIPNIPPKVFLDHDPKSLNNEPDNLKSMVKVFDPGIWEKSFSPTYVKLPFEDRHYCWVYRFDDYETTCAYMKTNETKGLNMTLCKETHESMPEIVVNHPTVVIQPKVWTDALIIEEYESDSEDEHVSLPSKEQETPSFANTIKHVKSPMQTVKQQNTCSKSPKPDKKDCSGLMSKKLGLGYGFTTKACFVCGSLSHLIRDCDFHEKRMAKQVELNKQKGKGNVQRENKPVWNNVQRVNHKNQFVSTAVLTRTGKIPVNTARHNFNSQAVLTNVARKISTVKPFVNELVLLGENEKLLLSLQQVIIGDPKDMGGTKSPNTMDYPQRALKNKGIVNSGCSRHMTGNKAYLAEYQDYNGGPVVFGELQYFNLFSVSQICDKKNKVLFTDTECLVLSPDFKLPDENQILLKVPRQNNMYSFNMKNIVPSGDLACLIAKATVDESNKWFSWVFFLRTKDDTSGILKEFIRQIENQLNKKVKTIRCDNGTKFKNRDIIEFYGSKGIKREYSNARTLQQNGVAERKNRTLIEAARTMLVDSFLPNTFWAEAVSTACYVLNRVLVTKPHNKTP
ncbi:ribonuclease H-like domain-containing protein [Tanacetum coccineum]